MGYVMEIFGMAGGGKSDKKLDDPNMTLHGKKPEKSECECAVRCYNMKRLMQDEKLRANKANGHVYAGFMSLKYQNGKED